MTESMLVLIVCQLVAFAVIAACLTYQTRELVKRHGMHYVFSTDVMSNPFGIVVVSAISGAFVGALLGMFVNALIAHPPIFYGLLAFAALTAIVYLLIVYRNPGTKRND
jgi:hypothetical protein